jgi:hypothetical protein
MSKYSVRDLATDHNLWDEYIDPAAQGEGDFDTMTTAEKMHMIVELWPEDVRDDDEDGQRLLSEIRNERIAAAVMLGRRGGKSTSAAKRTASRENGKRGGRPRKQPTS